MTAIAAPSSSPQPPINPFAAFSRAELASIEAMISQSRIAHPGLAAALRDLLSGRTGIMGEPMVEGSHPFVTAPITIGSLSGTLLHADFVKALATTEDDEHRVPPDRKPYAHQLAAWRALIEPSEARSVLVASGTGSGKTECFLYPILSDLAAQASQRATPLEGVQAIMLYPLNALIDSQRSRFEAWTKPFGGKIRYALYNRELPRESKREAARQNPHEISDRAALRASPPPLLVTNVTMLEYILARPDDQPIIEKSRGTLKWVVLDEAHSLAGSAAAEVALLLRRVLMAFGVEAQNVRFVATSATIGGGGDAAAAENARQRLRRFLADIAGIEDAKVEVIEGHRQLPVRIGPSTRPDTQDARSQSEQDYASLCADPDIWALVQRLHAGALSLAEFGAAARKLGLTEQELVFALAAAKRTDPQTLQEELLAPVRIHGFQRAVPGVWACVNPDCGAAPDQWSFGALVSERAEQCRHCSAPVLEVISCQDCGVPMLQGMELEAQSRLVAPMPHQLADEFAYHSDDEADEADNGDAAGDDDAGILNEIHRLFPARRIDGSRPFHLNRDTWQVAPGSTGPDTLTLNGVMMLSSHRENESCPCCGARPTVGRAVLRPFRFGAPFLISVAAPSLLGAVEADSLPGDRKPASGRRLLSFTDSRQGTARMAAKLETESERNFARAFIYHSVQHAMQPSPDDKEQRASLTAQLEALTRLGEPATVEPLKSMISNMKRQIAALADPSDKGKSWREMADELSKREEIDQHIRDVWKHREGTANLFQDGRGVAEMLMMREFSRRPTSANSLETLGLVRLRFPALERASQIPEPLLRRGKTKDDWHAFLHAIATFYLRANSAIDVTKNLQRWVMPRIRVLHQIGKPGEQVAPRGDVLAWPDAKSRTRPVLILIAGLGLDPSKPGDRDDINECMRKAYAALAACFGADNSTALDLKTAHLAPLRQGWLCPKTRRILDVAPFGLSPVALGQNTSPAAAMAKRVDLPVHPLPRQRDHDEDWRAQVEHWLRTDPAIMALRDAGAWNNLNDRIALYAPYARAAEHSAQIDSNVLKTYTSQFREGRINILNCSTTMEMGVDIGSVSAVMMTNVPPSIANYRQRVGRAGRRRQPVSFAYTFCKDRPLEVATFRDPAGFLARAIPAPAVMLESRPIVQRHVNAWALRSFFKSHGGDVLKMEAGPFFGCPSVPGATRPPEDERPWIRFRNWLAMPSTSADLDSSIKAITARSVLATEPPPTLVKDVIEMLDAANTRFEIEWLGLFDAIPANGQASSTGYSRRMGSALERLCREFLLSVLADAGFLPGHGFPTDVVAFDAGEDLRRMNDARSEFGRRDGNNPYSTGPQRQLDVALREYAPGSEVVLDGMVYRSAGVTLNWKRPASAETLQEVQSLKTFIQCEDCGDAQATANTPTEHCGGCGARTHALEFLRPGGFAVDPAKPAHAETDVVQVIAMEDPRVSARGERWRGMPFGDAIAIRATDSGLVYHANAGPKECGFAICLHCGRAAAEKTAKAVELPEGMIEHKPLRGRNAGAVCTGLSSSFAIVRNKQLGYDLTTSVMELRLDRPLNRPGVTALAIALRHGLAVSLGIDPEAAMGFATGKANNPLGGKAPTLALFDKASGGAGFATAFQTRAVETIREARRLLDCANPGCERGCPSCVLTRDAPDNIEKLDRKGALAFLDAHVMEPLQPAAADRIGGMPALCFDLADDVHLKRAAMEQPHLIVFLHEAPDFEDIAHSKVALFIAQCRQAAIHPVLRMPADIVQAMDAASRLALRDFVMLTQSTLQTASAPPLPNGHCAVAALVGADRKAWLWSSRDNLAAQVSDNWGEAGAAPVIVSAHDGFGSGEPVALDSLLPPPGVRYREIGNDCDGALTQFGKSFAGLIKKELAHVGVTPGMVLTAIEYSDSYVRSPLVLRLLLDTVSALRDGHRRTGSVALRVVTRMSDSDLTRTPRLFHHDFENEAALRALLLAVAATQGFAARLDCPSQTAHARSLTLTFDDGGRPARRRIILDQGFGAWGLARGNAPKFPFTAPIDVQQRALTNEKGGISRRAPGPTYIVTTR